MILKFRVMVFVEKCVLGLDREGGICSLKSIFSFIIFCLRKKYIICLFLFLWLKYRNLGTIRFFWLVSICKRLLCLSYIYSCYWWLFYRESAWFFESWKYLFLVFYRVSLLVFILEKRIEFFERVFIFIIGMDWKKVWSYWF